MGIGKAEGGEGGVVGVGDVDGEAFDAGGGPEAVSYTHLTLPTT